MEKRKHQDIVNIEEDDESYHDANSESEEESYDHRNKESSENGNHENTYSGHDHNESQIPNSKKRRLGAVVSVSNNGGDEDTEEDLVDEKSKVHLEEAGSEKRHPFFANHEFLTADEKDIIQRTAGERTKLNLIAKLCNSSRGSSRQEEVTSERKVEVTTEYLNGVARPETNGEAVEEKNEEKHSGQHSSNVLRPPNDERINGNENETDDAPVVPSVAHRSNMGAKPSSPPKDLYDSSSRAASYDPPEVRPHRSASQSSTGSKKTSYRFPVKLMRVLSCGKYDDVISWTPDGKAFVVHNQDELVEKVLPLNDFKGVKYSSFTRKLHRWGFVKILRGGSDSNHRSAYFHKNFQRGNFALCQEMRCSGKGDEDDLLQQYNSVDSVYHHADGAGVIPYPSELRHQQGLDSLSSNDIASSIGGIRRSHKLAALGKASSGLGDSKRSLDDTLKLLHAERELLLIEQQRKILREEEEKRRMYASSAPYGIAGLSYLSSLRNANAESLLLHGGYNSSASAGISNALPSSLHSTSGILEAPSSAALLSMSENAARGGHLLGSSALQHRATQEELLLASRRDLALVGGGGLLPPQERSSTSSYLHGYGANPLSIHHTTSTSIVRDSLNPASSSLLLDRNSLPRNSTNVASGDHQLAANTNLVRRGMSLEEVQEQQIRDGIQKFSSINHHADNRHLAEGHQNDRNSSSLFHNQVIRSQSNRDEHIRSSLEQRPSVAMKNDLTTVEEMKSHCSYENNE